MAYGTAGRGKSMTLREAIERAKIAVMDAQEVMGGSAAGPSLTEAYQRLDNAWVQCVREERSQRSIREMLQDEFVGRNGD
jgi:hypothetical protein